MNFLRKKSPLVRGLITGISLYIPLVTFAQYFPDIQDHPYQGSILFLQNRAIVKGYPDGTFGPDRTITRAEMMKIIFEATKVDLEEAGTHCFEDVTDDRYAPYVCYAKQEGIVKGYGDGTFKPDQEVTLAEGLKMALGSFDTGIQEDWGHRWYQPFVDFVHDNNIFSKYAIYPDDPMTRGEMSYLVHRLLLDKEGTIKFTGVRTNLSAGCGLRAPSNPPTSTFVHGMTRNYLVSMPRNYDEDKPYKLIVAFHGRTNSNEMVRSYYKLDREAGSDAIILYPSGLPEEGPTRNWQNGGDRPDDLRDYALFDALVEQFSNNYCVNMDEIYVIGHSLGGWFTNTLACARGDVIRGMGSVGGSITKSDCAGPVATMIMHNPKDNLAGFGGGLAARDHLLEANGCGSTTVSYPGPAQSNCMEYVDCMEGAPLVRCEHTQNEDHRGVYYPHVWPDRAGKLILEFWKTLS